MIVSFTGVILTTGLPMMLTAASANQKAVARYREAKAQQKMALANKIYAIQSNIKLKEEQQ